MKAYTNNIWKSNLDPLNSHRDQTQDLWIVNIPNSATSTIQIF